MAAQVKRTVGWPVSDRESPQAILLTGTRGHGGLSIRANLGEVDTQELHNPWCASGSSTVLFFSRTAAAARRAQALLPLILEVSIIGRRGVAGDSQAKRQITDYAGRATG